MAKGFQKLTTTKSLTGQSKVPPDEPVKCDVCGADAVKKYRYKLSGVGIADWIDCAICKERQAAERESIAAAQAAFRIRRAKERAGILDRLQDWHFRGYEVTEEGQMAAFNAATEFSKKFTNGDFPGWLALVGKNGTGKCHLAVSIANEIIEMGHRPRVMYTKLIRLMRRIRAAYGPSLDETEESIIRDIDRQDLLIIDEFGIKDKLSDWEKATLDDIIDHRWEQKKALIIISNMNAADAMKLAGERIESRFADYGKIVKFTWGDYRKRKKDAENKTEV